MQIEVGLYYTLLMRVYRGLGYLRQIPIHFYFMRTWHWLQPSPKIGVDHRSTPTLGNEAWQDLSLAWDDVDLEKPSRKIYVSFSTREKITSK